VEVQTEVGQQDDPFVVTCCVEGLPENGGDHQVLVHSFRAYCVADVMPED
jgi:hypothetical protein